MKMNSSSPFASRGITWMLMVAAAITAPTLSAREFDIGIPNVKTEVVADFRYNFGVRTEAPNQAIVNNTLFDESDTRFDRGDIVTNRADVTPQLTLTYKPSEDGWLKSWGVRASGNGFKDYAYDDDRLTCRPGTAPVGAPPGTGGSPAPIPLPGGQRISYCDPRILSYSTGRFNKAAKRAAFQDAELLDAFGFGNFNVGGVLVSIKAGQHGLFWGEALLNPFLGVSYAMGPVDLNKALTVPGAQAQDVFKPVNQVSGNITLIPTLSLGFQYFLDWKGAKAPEGGTYLGIVDPFLDAPDQLFAANLPSGPLTLKHAAPFVGENKKSGGVQLKWNPDFMEGGTFGLYYRKFDEILPWVALVSDPSNPALPGGYRSVFPKGTQLYGFSASHEIFGLSVSTEVAYGLNRGLNSQVTSDPADAGQRARGNTLSGVLNALYLGPAVAPFGLPLWDSSLVIPEINWSYLKKVTEMPQHYKGVGTDACKASSLSSGAGNVAETIDGCSSRRSIGAGLLFVPIWYQVFNGIDMQGTVFYSTGIKNNSAVSGGGNEGFNTGSLGLTANFYQQVSATLSYNYYDQQFRTGQNQDGETVVTSFNGAAMLADRDWVSLTLKYSF